MAMCYDIIVKCKKTNRTVFYSADSFSIDERGILRIKSYTCGDINVQIKPDEEIEIKFINVEDE